MQDLGGLEERLRRDAAAMEARAADLVLVDEGHAEAELSRPERRGVATGPRAEDDEVEVVRGTDGHSGGLWTVGVEGGRRSRPQVGLDHRSMVRASSRTPQPSLIEP